MNSGVPIKGEKKKTHLTSLSRKSSQKAPNSQITFQIHEKLKYVTNTVSSMRFPKDCCKAKITNLHFSLVAIDKDIVTLEISVDHRRVTAVKIEKPSQDLPTPVLYSSDINSLML